MHTKDLILTYDLGTTGNKCTIFDSAGNEQSSCVVPYDTFYPRAGWAEQNPLDFWESMVKGTHQLLSTSGISPSRIAVIGLSGHMNGCIPVDGEGTPLYPNIIHSDARCHLECQEIAQVCSEKDFYRTTGNRIDPHYTLPKILWLKRSHPEVYENTAYFLNTKDYAGYRLTGCLGITDYSDASLTAMLDMERKTWAWDLIRDLGIHKEKLPRLLRSIDIAGKLTPEAAGILGLVEGVPVVAGGGDGACATQGAGIVGQGKAYNYIGSSSWICTLNEGPILDEQARIFNYYALDGLHCNVCGTVQSATVSYDWVVENLGKYEVEHSRGDRGALFDRIEELAAQSPIGANGVFFLPYLMGERTPFWDKNTRGAFIGFTLYHKRQDLFRAVYEGISYALRSVLDVFRENRLEINELTLIGGGARSRFWNELMSHIYGRPLKVHRYPGEATSLGAAAAAGVGAGIFEDFQSAAQRVTYERTFAPNPELVQEYAKYYDIYKRMYPQLKPIYDAISEV